MIRAKKDDQLAYAPATVKRYRAILRLIYKTGIRAGLLVENPTDRVEPIKVDNEIERCLSEKDEEKLMAALAPRGYRRGELDLRPLVAVVLQTGFRRGEIVRMRWQDIEDSGFVDEQGKPFSSTIIHLPKTKSGRRQWIPINREVRQILDHLKAIRPKFGEDSNGQPIYPEYVFTTTDGRPIPADSITQRFAEAVKTSGIGPFRFHDLRHTFASRLAMRGVSLPTISRLLRHGKGSSACTERYIKYLPGALQDAVNQLESVQITQGVKIGSLTG
jgi:integrase